MVSSSSEILSYLVSGVLFEKAGLKITFATAYIISLAGMLGLIFYLGDENIVFSICVLGSKFGVSLVFNVAFLANYNLFPVIILTTTFGICNVFSRFLTVVAPYIAELKPEEISQIIFCVVIAASLTASMFIIDPRRKANQKDLRSSIVS